MLTLFHHPFCPHSRFVRLVLEELGLPVRLVEERVWERREEFLMLNPAGTTPVLVEEGAPPVPGAGVIAEYLDETHAAATVPPVRLLPFFDAWSQLHPSCDRARSSSPLRGALLNRLARPLDSRP